MSDDYTWDFRPAGLPAHYGAVRPNDPRIPPPAPDAVPLSPETFAPIILPQGAATPQPRQEEEDVPKKIGIYAHPSGEFIVSVLDEENDPVDSRRFPAMDIENKVRPLLESAGHKVVDYSGGALKEALTSEKVSPMRRTRRASNG